MRSIIALVALAASALASPLLDIARTEVKVDESRHTLDDGHVIVTIQRLDKLVSDDGAKTYLQRGSHVSLDVKLSDAVLHVNDEAVADLKADTAPAAIRVVKADVLFIPGSADSIDVAEVRALASKLAVGIAAVEVRVESEVVDAALAVPGSSPGVRIQSIPGVRVRRVGVFVALHEIDGNKVEHTSRVYVPVVQLLVQDAADASGKPHVTTLSVNGNAPVDLAPGPVMLGAAAAAAVPAVAVRPRLGRPCAKGGRMPMPPHGWHSGGGRHHRGFGCLLRKVARYGVLVMTALLSLAVVKLLVFLVLALVRGSRADEHDEDEISDETAKLLHDVPPVYAEHDTVVVVDEKKAEPEI